MAEHQHKWQFALMQTYVVFSARVNSKSFMMIVVLLQPSNKLTCYKRVLLLTSSLPYAYCVHTMKLQTPLRAEKSDNSLLNQCGAIAHLAYNNMHFQRCYIGQYFLSKHA